MLQKYHQLDRDMLDLSKQDFMDCWYNNKCDIVSYAEVFFDRVTCEGAVVESRQDCGANRSHQS
jgi:hypothetical protein